VSGDAEPVQKRPNRSKRDPLLGTEMWLSLGGLDRPWTNVVNSEMGLSLGGSDRALIDVLFIGTQLSNLYYTDFE
jgi:hypothetical protein